MVLDDILERLPEGFDMLELADKLQVRRRPALSLETTRHEVHVRPCAGLGSTPDGRMCCCCCCCGLRLRLLQGEERTPFTNVFLQEIERMNVLLGVMKESLFSLDLGLKVLRPSMDSQQRPSSSACRRRGVPR